MNKHLIALEFDKILERLAEYTCCEDSRELALGQRPVHEACEAQALMNQTRDAHMLLARFGIIHFAEVMLTRMTERCVSKVVSKSRRLGQVLV